ncbi:MAG: hypothetical protein LC768_07950 [Acidobacteria bacterium]|nr:hypothetical protein [Acidobacteriota bacterium]MCA1638252.1 hypothetical protein [Acidobacteriota bacterium]
MKQIIFTVILILAFCFAAFAQANKNSCPKIILTLPHKPLFPKEFAYFIVKINEAEKFNVEYLWTVSTGKIIQGQGTSKIEFLAGKENQGANVNVSVKVNGLPKNCTDTASDVIGIIQLPIGEPYGNLGKHKSTKNGLLEYLATLDGFLISVRENGLSEGLIVLRFDKKDNRSYKISLLQ